VTTPDDVPRPPDDRAPDNRAADDRAPDERGRTLVPAWSFVPFTPPPRRPLGPSLRAAALVVAGVGLLGVPFGALWRLISPDVPVVLTRIGPYPVDQQPEQFIAADGWFAILGAALGVVVTVTVWVLLRRHRGPVQLAATVLGGLAAGVLAWQVGRWPGHAEFVRWKSTVALGTTGVQPTDLRAYSVLLVPAFAVVIAYTLLAGWAHDPDLIDEPAPALSSDWPAAPAPTAEPAPRAPGAAVPPPD
jgi:hypothetical protein